VREDLVTTRRERARLEKFAVRHEKGRALGASGRLAHQRIMICFLS